MERHYDLLRAASAHIVHLSLMVVAVFLPPSPRIRINGTVEDEQLFHLCFLNKKIKNLKSNVTHCPFMVFKLSVTKKS